MGGRVEGRGDACHMYDCVLFCVSRSLMLSQDVWDFIFFSFVFSYLLLVLHPVLIGIFVIIYFITIILVTYLP